MKAYDGDTLIRIAVAEDHTMFREAVCKEINSWEECKVILQAGNGKDLLDRLQPHHLPDIVLVDLNMPVMNGYETISLLNRRYPAIKLLVLSVYNSEETLCRILKAGGHGFLCKDDNLQKLRKGFREMLRTGYFFTNHAASKMMKQSLQTGTLLLKNDLSEEELRFLQYVCSEKTYKAIAAEMGISNRHAEYLRRNLFDRFEVQSRTGLATTAVERGLFL